MSAGGRVVVAGSMPEFVHMLLDETPRVEDALRQQALTDRYLVPVLPALDALFRTLRAEADGGLRAARPTHEAKPYPLGQCYQITEAVRTRLAGLRAGDVSGLAAEGFAAITTFLAAGGHLRRAWGDLRGRYFQNAMILGSLYVDVANDTVVIDKPPVEILPFAAADFRPIADYGHFARIARAYWGHDVLPNHIVPQLAPYLPLIQIGPTGQVTLGASNRYMLGLTLSAGFAPSVQVLAAPALPPSIFAGLRDALGAGPIAVAPDAEAGRRGALAACRAYRAAGRATCDRSYNGAMAAAREVNAQLAQLVVIPLRDGPNQAASRGQAEPQPSLRPRIGKRWPV